MLKCKRRWFFISCSHEHGFVRCKLDKRTVIGDRKNTPGLRFLYSSQKCCVFPLNFSSTLFSIFQKITKNWDLFSWTREDHLDFSLISVNKAVDWKPIVYQPLWLHPWKKHFHSSHQWALCCSSMPFTFHYCRSQAYWFWVFLFFCF